MAFEKGRRKVKINVITSRSAKELKKNVAKCFNRRGFCSLNRLSFTIEIKLLPEQNNLHCGFHYSNYGLLPVYKETLYNNWRQRYGLPISNFLSAEYSKGLFLEASRFSLFTFSLLRCFYQWKHLKSEKLKSKSENLAETSTDLF